MQKYYGGDEYVVFSMFFSIDGEAELVRSFFERSVIEMNFLI